MKKIKFLYFLIPLLLLISLFFKLGERNIKFDENSLISPRPNFLGFETSPDVVIIFNSGGWGNTPIEEAEDFAPIIEGMKKTLNQLGYNSIVIPYNRTKDNLFGRIEGTREVLNSFQFQSKILAVQIEDFLENNQGTKVIMAGLSMGGSFVNQTMENLSEETQNYVYAVIAGVPFWTEPFESDSILQLDNDGKDSLAEGNVKSLTLSLIKSPFKWLFSKFNGQNFKFSQALQVPGHDYKWPSSETGPKIVNFLKEKF